MLGDRLCYQPKPVLDCVGSTELHDRTPRNVSGTLYLQAPFPAPLVTGLGPDQDRAASSLAAMELLYCTRCSTDRGPSCGVFLNLFSSFVLSSAPVHSMAQDTLNEVSNDDDFDAILATLVTSSSLARTPSPSGPRLSPVRDRSYNDEFFVQKCFPQPHQHCLRAKLRGLLQKPWLAANNLEPSGDLQFLLDDSACGGQKCVICTKVLRRGGRALEHVRAHLGHRPYQCHGGFKSCSFLLW